MQTSSAFGQELQVVVVGLREMLLLAIDRLIEQRGRPERVDPGADEGKPAGDPPGIAPDPKTAADVGRPVSGEACSNAIEPGPPRGGEATNRR